MKRLVRIALGLAVVPLGILGYQAGLRAEGNFREVLPDQFYRSAQLSSRSLDKAIRDYGIRTVVNLRGAQPDAAWYREEREVVKKHGARLVDFPMSASRKLDAARAQELVALMKSAARPILVHCWTGADRTGLVSVIYTNQVAGMDEEKAERQLSAYYGHFGIPLFSPTFAMDESWEELEKVFGIEGS